MAAKSQKTFTADELSHFIFLSKIEKISRFIFLGTTFLNILLISVLYISNGMDNFAFKMYVPAIILYYIFYILRQTFWVVPKKVSKVVVALSRKDDIIKIHTSNYSFLFMSYKGKHYSFSATEIQVYPQDLSIPYLHYNYEALCIEKSPEKYYVLQELFPEDIKDYLLPN
ncbi:MAG: hypothetical protein R2798_04660 [Chitinophagales bacterium]|nr:hypothetical protein [Bacteroidota bacterium]